MDSFPIFLNLRHATPLVIGNGHLAVAKVRTLLLRAGRVDIMCDTLPTELKKFAASGKIKILPPIKNTKDKKKWRAVLAGRPLVVVDPQLTAVVELLYPLCLEIGLPINVADNIEKSSFSFGAMVDRRPLTVAIATDGIVPVLATDIRQKLEQAIPAEVGPLMALARQYRPRVNQLLPMGLKRRLFWQEFLQGEVATMVRTARDEINRGHIDDAVETLLASLLRGDHEKFRQHNNLFLLGLQANQGGCDDLSLAMLQAIKNADTIVVMGEDAIFSDILSLARREVVIKKISAAQQTTPSAVANIVSDLRGEITAGEAVAVLAAAENYEAIKASFEKAGIAVRGFKPIYETDQNDDARQPARDIHFTTATTKSLNKQ
ncbi:MAG: NAD(P)-dependent oxidoreductase [Hydrotalea sp.]|nr:NAD(P)-dependent oxidoreductase [Hydrotalea sp.]